MKLLNNSDDVELYIPPLLLFLPFVSITNKTMNLDGFLVFPPRPVVGGSRIEMVLTGLDQERLSRVVRNSISVLLNMAEWTPKKTTPFLPTVVYEVARTVTTGPVGFFSHTARVLARSRATKIRFFTVPLSFLRSLQWLVSENQWPSLLVL